MESLNKRQQVFVRELVRSGDRVVAYQTAFKRCKTLRGAASNAVRLMKKDNIREAIHEQRQKINSIVMVEASKQAISEKVGDILFYMKKREILAQIVNRKYLIKKTVYMNGKEVNYFTEPDYVVILKAIELDNRMAGDFSYDKSGTIKNQEDAASNKMSDEQFYLLVELLKKPVHPNNSF